MAKMQVILNKAYELLVKYKANRPLDVCTVCCMKVEDEKLLASLAVKEIPKYLLQTYNDEASSAKTPVDEIKHFLPRYLEFASQFEFPTHSTELTFRRLEPFLKEEWSEQELELLKEYAQEFFKSCLSNYPLPSGDTIDSILIMLRHEPFQIGELLNIWQRNNSLQSTLHFSDLYQQGFKAKNPNKMNNGFSNESISKILRNWVDSEEVKQFFSQAIELIILGNNETEETELNQLNALYEMMN